MQVNVFARDVKPGAFAQIHAVRREFFPTDPPASTMVEVTRLVDDRYLIEINAVAVI
jgi:enamine deaminase RidA (YjgF/YER057c/UK114 family)